MIKIHGDTNLLMRSQIKFAKVEKLSEWFAFSIKNGNNKIILTLKLKKLKRKRKVRKSSRITNMERRLLAEIRKSRRKPIVVEIKRVNWEKKRKEWIEIFGHRIKLHNPEYFKIKRKDNWKIGE